MKTKLLNVLLFLSSLGASGIFCWLGFSLVSAASDSVMVAIAGFVILAYGITSAIVLCVALFWPTQQFKLVSWSLAVVLFLSWVIGSLDYGHISGQEAWSLLGVLALLAINLGSVIRIINNAAAQPRVQPGRA